MKRATFRGITSSRYALFSVVNELLTRTHVAVRRNRALYRFLVGRLYIRDLFPILIIASSRYIAKRENMLESKVYRLFKSDLTKDI